MNESPAFTQLTLSAGVRPTTRGEMAGLWVVGLAFAALMLASLIEQYVPQKLSVLFFITFWPLMLLLHELGHAGMARLLGWRVGHLSLGFGPVLWRGQVAGTAVTLRAVPIEGYVVPAPNSASGARWKSALVYAAGPGAELALLGALIALFGADAVFSESTEPGALALKTLAIVIIWGAGFNLLPFAFKGGVSDGLGILLSPLMDDDGIEQRLTTLEEMAAEELANAGRTDEAVALLDRLIGRNRKPDRLIDQSVAILAAAGEHDAARERLAGRLPETPISEMDDVGLLHLDALTHLAAEKPDAFSLDLSLNRARRLAPDNRSLDVTRGIADIRRGRTVEGADRLAAAYRSLDAPMDGARALGWLAVAAQRVGHEPAFVRFRNAFEHFNDHKPLRDQIHAQIKAEQSTSGRSPDRP
ncbi:MAG: site-2 protease family protein [Pseudomonadota bacterium]